jgi:hypothetical protein
MLSQKKKKCLLKLLSVTYFEGRWEGKLRQRELKRSKETEERRH